MSQKVKTNKKSSLQHFESLTTNDIIAFLENISNYYVTEKLDGSNLWFGIDECGFYTSREGKSGRRIYDVCDYPIEFKTSYMRIAHVALLEALPVLEENGLSEGDCIEVEVLHGNIPNTVKYNEGITRIIFLRSVSGSANVCDLKNGIMDSVVNITIPVISTDKLDMLCEEVNEPVIIDCIPEKSCESIISKSDDWDNLIKHKDTMVSYLNNTSEIVDKFTNGEILNMKLNAKPADMRGHAWSDLKTYVKMERSAVKRIVDEHKYVLKEMLSKIFLHDVTSAFGPSVERGGWIEGVVITNVDSGCSFKVVNKDKFTIVNAFNHHYRNLVSKNVLSANHTGVSIMGDLSINLSSSIGFPKLGTIHRNSFIKKNSVTDICDHLDSINQEYDEIAAQWNWYITEASVKLTSLYNEYISVRSDLALSVGGQTYTYCESIHTRTMQAFYTAFENLKDKTISISNANSYHDLVNILI